MSFVSTQALNTTKAYTHTTRWHHNISWIVMLQAPLCVSTYIGFLIVAIERSSHWVELDPLASSEYELLIVISLADFIGIIELGLDYRLDLIFGFVLIWFLVISWVNFGLFWIWILITFLWFWTSFRTWTCHSASFHWWSCHSRLYPKLSAQSMKFIDDIHILNR